MALDQLADPDCMAAITAISSLQLQMVSIPSPGGQVSMLCDVADGKHRIYVPSNWRRIIFDKIHGLAHVSKRATEKLIKTKYLWHSISRDIAHWCKTCLTCQQNKVHKHVKQAIQAIPVPEQRFSHVHINLVGPLEISEGKFFILTMTDRTTRWPEAVPLPDSRAETCVRAFFHMWISCFGIPEVVTSDRGVQFTSSLWSEMSRILGIATSFCTAYHPQANGMVERMHRTLKNALCCRLSGPNWTDELLVFC